MTLPEIIRHATKLFNLDDPVDRKIAGDWIEQQDNIDETILALAAANVRAGILHSTLSCEPPKRDNGIGDGTGNGSGAITVFGNFKLGNGTGDGRGTGIGTGYGEGHGTSASTMHVYGVGTGTGTGNGQGTCCGHGSGTGTGHGGDKREFSHQ